MNKIIIATIMRPTGETGVQTHFNCFGDYLFNQKIDHELVTPFSYYKILVYPVFAVRKVFNTFSGNLSVFWYRYWHGYFLERALKKNLKKNKECVIYAQCPLSAKAALNARVSPKQKIVLVVHFNISQADEWAEKKFIKAGEHLYNAIRRLEASTLPRLDGLVFVSEFMRQQLINKIPEIKSVPSAIIPNFIPDPGASSTVKPTADLISIGTLEPRKNQQYLLDIIAELRKQGKPRNLTIVGDGPDREALEHKARALEIEDLVKFSGFKKNAAELIDHHKSYIHVATIENLPLTLIEATAHARPIFAVPVGGIPEILINNLTGAALPPDNPEKAADIIAGRLNDDAWMQAAGQAAREQFLKKFSSDVAAKKLTGFLGGIPNR